MSNYNLVPTMDACFKWACEDNALDRVRSMIQNDDIDLQHQNNALVKYCCSLPNAVDLISVILELCPHLDLHIDNDIITKDACTNKNYDLVKILVQRYPKLKSWNDFDGVIMSTMYQKKLLSCFLIVDSGLISRLYLKILYGAVKNSNLETVTWLLDCHRYDNMDVDVDWNYVSSLANDVLLLQWLWDRSLITTDIKVCQKLFWDNFNTQNFDICRWILHHYNISDKRVRLGESIKSWYQLLDTPEVINNVTSVMILNVISYIFLKDDELWPDSLVSKYSHIVIDANKGLEILNTRMIQWLYDRSLIPVKYIDELFYKSLRGQKLELCRWILNHYQVKIDTIKYLDKNLYDIINIPQIINGVTDKYLIKAIGYLIEISDVDAIDRLLIQYSNIAINSSHLDKYKSCMLDDYDSYMHRRLKLKYLPMIQYLASISSPYRKVYEKLMTYTHPLVIESNDQVDQVLPKLRLDYKPSGQYHPSIVWNPLKYNDELFIIIFDYVCKNNNSSAIEYILEHFPITLEACLRFARTNASCKYLHEKDPKATIKFINDNVDDIKSYVNCGHNDSSLWLLHVSYSINMQAYTKLYNRIRTCGYFDYHYCKVSDETRDVPCSICKKIHNVIRLPCGHYFCLKSLIDLHVTEGIDHCIQCSKKYEWDRCVEYYPSLMTRLFS